MTTRWGVLHPSFWDGTTGLELQQRGKDAVILATYLTANEHANMIGLYALPLAAALEDLPVLESMLAIDAAVAALQAVSFAHYDPDAEIVWVQEMARFRLNLQPHQRLAADDNRRKGAVRLYEQLPENRFLGPFYDRYHRQLRLAKRRGTEPSPPSDGGESESPKGLPKAGQSEGAKGIQIEGPKGLRNEGAKGISDAPDSTSAAGTCTGTSVRTDQVPDQDQDQDQVRTYAPTLEVLPTPDVRGRTDRARTTTFATLVTPPRQLGSYAYPNDVVGVPMFAHRRFVERLVNAGAERSLAERQLFDWYDRTIEEWRGQEIGDRELSFWDKRFEEWRGSTPRTSTSLGSVAARNADFIARRRGAR